MNCFWLLAAHCHKVIDDIDEPTVMVEARSVIQALAVRRLRALTLSSPPIRSRLRPHHPAGERPAGYSRQFPRR